VRKTWKKVFLGKPTAIKEVKNDCKRKFQKEEGEEKERKKGTTFVGFPGTVKRPEKLVVKESSLRSYG